MREERERELKFDARWKALEGRTVNPRRITNAKERGTVQGVPT